MTTESNAAPAPGLDLDRMREIALDLGAWRSRFDELFVTFSTRALAVQSQVSEPRLWRYKRGKVKWLTIPEYLKLYAVMTMTRIPNFMDDPLKAAERRPRRKPPPNARGTPGPEKVPDPFKNLELE